MLVSTPTNRGASRIEAAYAESDPRQFWVPCPACGVHQVLVWDQVRWEEGADEMIAQRDALLAARARAVRTVEVEGRRVSYATDAEMAAALGDLERRIAQGQAGTRRRIVRTAANKGL